MLYATTVLPEDDEGKKVALDLLDKINTLLKYIEVLEVRIETLEVTP